MRGLLFFTLINIVAFQALAAPAARQINTPSNGVNNAVPQMAAPRTVALNSATLVRTRALWQNPSTRDQVDASIAGIIQKAVMLLPVSSSTIWAVALKDQAATLAVTGIQTDVHDYISAGPYWWPNATAPCRAGSRNAAGTSRRAASARDVQSENAEYLMSVASVINGGGLTPYQFSKTTACFNAALRTSNANINNYSGGGGEALVDIVEASDPSTSGSATSSSAGPAPPTTGPNSGPTFVRCDGHTNPLLNATLTDKSNMVRMMNVTFNLGLAYWYTGDERYAQNVARVVRTWFLNPATAMNPNLNHAQMIPGKSAGNKEGIIEFVDFVNRVLDPLALLRARNSPWWTGADHQAMLAWSSQMLQWLKTNPLAIAERDNFNNHALWFKSLAMGIAAHVGDADYIQQLLQQATARDIVDQVAPSGLLPFEATRTRSRHYTVFATLPLFKIAAQARAAAALYPAAQQTIQAGAQGVLSGAKRAADWLLPYATLTTAWPYFDQDDNSEFRLSSEIFQLAAGLLGDASYSSAVQKITAALGPSNLPLDLMYAGTY